MSIEVTARLLTRYHQGQCGVDEKEAIMIWIRGRGEERSLPEPENTHKARIWEV